DHLDYSGFGGVTNETNTANGDRYKFTAREYDSESGLQYNRARYYDSVVGRWITPDPIGIDAGDPNLYRYVNNSPTNGIDPQGLFEVPEPGGKFYFETDSYSKSFRQGAKIHGPNAQLLKADVTKWDCETLWLWLVFTTTSLNTRVQERFDFA